MKLSYLFEEVDFEKLKHLLNTDYSDAFEAYKNDHKIVRYENFRESGEYSPRERAHFLGFNAFLRSIYALLGDRYPSRRNSIFGSLNPTGKMLKDLKSNFGMTKYILFPINGTKICALEEDFNYNRKNSLSYAVRTYFETLKSPSFFRDFFDGKVNDDSFSDIIEKSLNDFFITPIRLFVTYYSMEFTTIKKKYPELDSKLSQLSKLLRDKNFDQYDLINDIMAEIKKTPELMSLITYDVYYVELDNILTQYGPYSKCVEKITEDLKDIIVKNTTMLDSKLSDKSFSEIWFSNKYLLINYDDMIKIYK